MADENIIVCDEDELDMAALTAAQQPKNYLVRNHYYFNDDITPETARQLIVNLHELALTISNECLNSGLLPCPIELHINSNGGSLIHALQIVQVIKDIQSGKACQVGDSLIPIAVNTHIQGNANSGGSLIAAVGSHRTISKYAMSLIHSMRSIDTSFKTTKERDVAIENDRKWDEIYKNIYLEHSALTPEELEKIFETESFYTPEQLLKFGLVEEIV